MTEHYSKQTNSEPTPSGQGVRRDSYVIIAEGEGAMAQVVTGEIHEALHEFMCCCGKPWEKCATEFVIADIRRIDDADSWSTDEDGKPFGISWEYEAGRTMLYKMSSALSPDPWISVEERLPAIGQHVHLLIGGTVQKMPASLFKDEGRYLWEWLDDSCDAAYLEVASHWCELPQPIGASVSAAPSPAGTMMPQVNQEIEKGVRIGETPLTPYGVEQTLKLIEAYRSGYSCGYSDGKIGAHMRDKDAAVLFFKVEGVPDVDDPSRCPIHGDLRPCLDCEKYRRRESVHETAERIIKRVVSNTLSLAHTRHSLDDADGDPIEEKDFILDGLQIALGEDTGCLDPDELSAENCEVLYVEKELREILESSAPSPAGMGELVEALNKIGNIVGRPITSYASAETRFAQQTKKLTEVFEIVERALRNAEGNSK